MVDYQCFFGLVAGGKQLPVCCWLFCVNQDFQDFKIFKIWVEFWCFVWFIFGLLIISGFAGFLPVVAGGFVCKWLIISVFLGLLLVDALAGLLFVSWFLGLHTIAGMLSVVAWFFRFIGLVND